MGAAADRLRSTGREERKRPPRERGSLAFTKSGREPTAVAVGRFDAVRSAAQILCGGGHASGPRPQGAQHPTTR